MQVGLVAAERLRDYLRAHGDTSSGSYLGGRVTDPSDPLNTGLQGAYPSIDVRAPWRLPRLLYARVGLYRTIVDLPAEDIWSAGWSITTGAPDLDDQVALHDERLGVIVAFQQATKLARRDGYALIRIRLKDNTGDTAQPPMGVREIVRLEVLPRTAVQDVEYYPDDDPDHPGDVKFWNLRPAPEYNDGRFNMTTRSARTTSSKTVKFHHERIIFVCPHPTESNAWDGESVLSWVLGDGQGLENVKWAAGESFAQYASPPLKVTLEKDVEFTDAELDLLASDIANLQRGTTNKIVLDGATVELIGGTGTINTPDPYANLFRDHVLAGARIPTREVFGNASTGLATADYDTKRYMRRIDNDRKHFANPNVRSLYERYDRWGIFPGLAAKVQRIEWFPNLELEMKERIEVFFRVAIALRNIAGLQLVNADGTTTGLPMPKEALDFLTFPDSVDTSLPLALSPVAAPPGPVTNMGLNRRAKPRSEAKTTRRVRWDLRIEASPKLRKLEDRYVTKVGAVIREWEKQADAAIDQHLTAREARRMPWSRRPERNAGLPMTIQQAIIGMTFDGTPLEGVMLDLLQEAGQLGQMRTWESLGQTGELQDFIDSPSAPTIKTIAQKFGAEKAAAAQAVVRKTVADVMAKGGGVTELRAALRDAFGRLQNEATIARTESMRGWNEGSRVAMREGGVSQWQWQAYEGADDLCQQLDGQVFDLDAPMPPDASHPNCRCVPVPYLGDGL